MTDNPAQDEGLELEEENSFHIHARMTVDLSLVSANVFGSAFQDNMPEATKEAYQQLWRRMLADKETRRRLLATMLIEKCIELYHNEDDILTDLAEEEDLVNEEGNRIEISDLALEHLVDDAPYYWWKDKAATESTFL